MLASMPSARARVKIPHAVQRAGRSATASDRGATSGLAVSHSERHAGAERDSLAPAVTRAGAILDMLAENAGRPPARASSPAGWACRSRRSRTSATPWRTSAWSGGSGPASPSAGSWRSSAARTSLRSTRCRSSTRPPSAADRLGGDRPVRGPRRARDDLSRAARRPPAGAADVADRPPAARDVRPRPARRRSLRSTETSSNAGSPDVDELPGRRASRTDGRTSSGPTSTRSGERGYAMDDEETMEGVVCFGVMIPGRQPGDGPSRRASRSSRCGRPPSGCRS